MEDLITSVFATHNPNWADVQSLLNILPMEEERRAVLNKVNEEAHCLHGENPSRTLNPAMAVPLQNPLGPE